MAYELLSRNPKSGYFVLNFDTQSVKLGFKNWLKNAPILPISGGPVTFRPSLDKVLHRVGGVTFYAGGTDVVWGGRLRFQAECPEIGKKCHFRPQKTSRI